MFRGLAARARTRWGTRARRSGGRVEKRQGGEPRACVSLAQRKNAREPGKLWRRCACTAQGRRLCGVCVLHRAWARPGALLFPDVTYRVALAFTKAGAAELRFPNALQWGAHAFRRGRAEEILKTQGPAAMFAQGGWRSVAAFAYAGARSLSEAVSAEEAIEHSDSSEEDGAMDP